MRIHYTDNVIMLKTTGNDRYGQPVLSSSLRAVKVKWQQKEDEVIAMAPFPIPSGCIIWYGDLDSYKRALADAPKEGINLWLVSLPSYIRDIKGRIAYWTASLKMFKSTNISTVP